MKHETLPKAVEDLLAGRAKIAAGWCQRQFRVYRPECLGGTVYCALGALCLADGPGRAARAWLHSALPNGFIAVSWYNDRPERTQADILALYDRAIALALAGE